MRIGARAARAVVLTWLACRPMSRRAESVGESDEVALTKVRAKLTRSMAITGQIPWITVPLGIVLTAWVIAGEETTVNLNGVANVSLTVAVPAAVAKVVWDRTQKQRLRKRCTELEESNDRLNSECHRLTEEVKRLRGLGGNT